jgi:hypothetical protein
MYHRHKLLDLNDIKYSIFHVSTSKASSVFKIYVKKVLKILAVVESMMILAMPKTSTCQEN